MGVTPSISEGTALRALRSHRSSVSLRGTHNACPLLPAVLDLRLSPSGPDRAAERRNVIGAYLPLTVHEEARGSGHAAHVSALDIRGNAFAPSAVLEVLREGL